MWNCLFSQFKKNIVISIVFISILGFSSVFAESINVYEAKLLGAKRFTHPDKIILVKLNPKITDPKKFVESLDLLFVDNLKQNQNIFSYVSIDKDVYKLRDLDENYNSNVNDDKLAYIAYTTTPPLQLLSDLNSIYGVKKFVNGSLDLNKNKFNITETTQFDTELPSSQIDLKISLPELILEKNVDPGTIIDAKVKFINNSEYPIIKSDKPKVVILSVKENKESPSPMNVNNQWYSNTRTGTIEEDRIGNGETGTINFKILTAAMSGNQIGKFALGNSNGTIYPNTEFDISLDIKDNKQKVVEVKGGGYGFVNIRDDKKLTARVLAFANKGDQLIVTEDQGYWMKVKFEGTVEGWIQSVYTKKLN